MIGAFLQVLFGNALNQVAPVNEKRVRKSLNNQIIWVGKDLWRSLVQPIAQSQVMSKLRAPSSSPTRSSDPTHGERAPSSSPASFLPPHQRLISPEPPPTEEASLLFSFLHMFSTSALGLLLCLLPKPSTRLPVFTSSGNPLSHSSALQTLLWPPPSLPAASPVRMSAPSLALPGHAPCTNSFHMGQLMDSVSHGFYI